MAGTKIKDEFRELISPFLKSKMIKAERELGKDSSDYIALEKQYIINNSEIPVMSIRPKEVNHITGPTIAF